MSTRGQVQLGEVIVIVIVVILLIVFGFVFYTRWTEASLKVQSGSFQEMDAYAVASIAANLPELHCMKNNVVDAICYDVTKIRAMAFVMDASKKGGYRVGPVWVPVSPEVYYYYTSLFKNAKLVVYEVYPGEGMMSVVNASDDPFHYVVYDNPPANIMRQIPARIPILLYNPVNGESRFGVMEVVKYS